MEVVVSIFAFFGLSCLCYFLLKLISAHTPEKSQAPFQYFAAYALMCPLFLLSLLAMLILGPIENHLLQLRFRQAEKDKADHLNAYHSALQSIRNAQRSASHHLHASPAEQHFAASIAAGFYTEPEIPDGMDPDIVMELADYYMAERSLGGPPIPDEYIPQSKSILRINPFVRNIISALLVVFLVCGLVLYTNLHGFPYIHPSSQGKENTPLSSPYVSDHTTMLFGSIHSDIVHTSSCRYAKQILEENRVYYITIENAKKDGRTPCSVCLGK